MVFLWVGSVELAEVLVIDPKVVSIGSTFAEKFWAFVCKGKAVVVLSFFPAERDRLKELMDKVEIMSGSSF